MSDNIFDKVPDLKHSEPVQKTNWEEFKKVVLSRRSVRVYTDEKVPDSVVNECIDMALLAPNSSNLQPWEFYYIKTPELKKQVDLICMNQPAARTAPVIIGCVARTKTWKKHAQQQLDALEQNPQSPKSALMYYKKIVPIAYSLGPLGIFGPFKKIAIFFAGLFKITPRIPTSESEMREWAVKSTALACENLMLAFSAAGYDTCPMEGFDQVRAKKLLKLPGDASVVMFISAGKRAPNGIYGPRIRFHRNQFVKTV